MKIYAPKNLRCSGTTIRIQIHQVGRVDQSYGERRRALLQTPLFTDAIEVTINVNNEKIKTVTTTL